MAEADGRVFESFLRRACEAQHSSQADTGANSERKCAGLWSGREPGVSQNVRGVVQEVQLSLKTISFPASWN